MTQAGRGLETGWSGGGRLPHDGRRGRRLFGGAGFWLGFSGLGLGLLPLFRPFGFAQGRLSPSAFRLLLTAFGLVALGATFRLLTAFLGLFEEDLDDGGRRKRLFSPLLVPASFVPFLAFYRGRNMRGRSLCVFITFPL